MTPQSKNHKDWLSREEAKNALYILDVCDTFDHSHYPVYIKTEEELAPAMIKYNENMQRIVSKITVDEK